MNGEIQQLKRKFNEIIKMGWIESDKINYGIIGETFEKLIGLTKNNFEIPDFGNIEIKTKSKGKFNHICLFNCAPTGPHYHEVEIIKDTFGYPDLSLKEYKVFNGDVYCNKLNKIGFKFYFKLNVHKEENKITLNAYNNKKQKIGESTYWDFDILKEKLVRKLNYLALVDTEKKIVNGKLLFRYKNLHIYKLKSFDAFIDMIEMGLIKITFKLNVYRDIKRMGKIHDRGTAFSIASKNIDMLFDSIK